MKIEMKIRLKARIRAESYRNRRLVGVDVTNTRDYIDVSHSQVSTPK